MSYPAGTEQMTNSEQISMLSVWALLFLYVQNEAETGELVKKVHEFFGHNWQDELLDGSQQLLCTKYDFFWQKIYILPREVVLF